MKNYLIGTDLSTTSGDGANSRLADGESRTLCQSQRQAEAGCCCTHHHRHGHGQQQQRQHHRHGLCLGRKNCSTVCGLYLWTVISVCGGNAGKNQEDAAFPASSRPALPSTSWEESTDEELVRAVVDFEESSGVQAPLSLPPHPPPATSFHHLPPEPQVPAAALGAPAAAIGAPAALGAPAAALGAPAAGDGAPAAHGDPAAGDGAPAALGAPAAAHGAPAAPAPPPAGSAGLLPLSWRATLTAEQQDWIGRVLFSRDSMGRARLIGEPNLWWYQSSTLLDAGRGTKVPVLERRVSNAAASVDPSDDRFLVTAASMSKLDPVHVDVEEDVRGPDGRPGYQHVVHLALALVDLRHHPYMTQRQKERIIELWQKLAAVDQKAVTFTPRHQETRAKRRRGRAVPPDTSRLMEAIFLELQRIHKEGRTIAGVRLTRWGAVLWDYELIRDNVLNSRDLMAAAPFQLFEVNQRSLQQWHQRRNMAMMLQPTAAPSTCTAAPSTSTAAPSTSTAAPSTAAPSASTAPPPPPPPPPAQRRWPTTIAPAPPGLPPPPPAPPRVPRTTQYRKRKAAQAAAARQGPPPEVRPRLYVCSKCGQPKRIETGHTRIRGVSYCATAGGRSVEEWSRKMRRQTHQAGDS
ncbi:uncharacterized protein V6R79_003950 [Siganus canaliculatus]